MSSAHGKASAKPATAKIFMHGRSQAVRLPKEFRLPGTEVAVSRMGDQIVLTPVVEKFDVKRWRAGLRDIGAGDFLPEGRSPQPPMPIDDITFD